jgi:hypothetical protein
MEGEQKRVRVGEELKRHRKAFEPAEILLMAA